MATRIRNPLRRLIGLASLGAAYAQSEVTAPITGPAHTTCS